MLLSLSKVIFIFLNNFPFIDLLLLFSFTVPFIPSARKHDNIKDDSEVGLL